MMNNYGIGQYQIIKALKMQQLNCDYCLTDVHKRKWQDIQVWYILDTIQFDLITIFYVK